WRRRGGCSPTTARCTCTWTTARPCWSTTIPRRSASCASGCRTPRAGPSEAGSCATCPPTSAIAAGCGGGGFAHDQGRLEQSVIRGRSPFECCEQICQHELAEFG